MEPINLQTLVDNADDFELPIITTLRKTLETEPDASLAAKLADDIKSLSQSEVFEDGSTEGIEGSLFYIWMSIIDIARCTPADDPWQDRLAQALDILRQTDDSDAKEGVSEWSDLPSLDLCMLDRWNINQDAESEEPFTEEDFEQWKNQNSFAARITSPSYSPWLNFPVNQLREALEEPLIEGKKSNETSLWVACEWILRCGQLIFDLLRSQKEMKDSLRPGSLCSIEIDLLGTGRWEFWTKRFREVLYEAETLELENSIVERISETVKMMDAIHNMKDIVASNKDEVLSKEGKETSHPPTHFS